MNPKTESQQEIAYLKIINEFTVNLLKQDSIENIVWSVAKDVIAHLGFVDCVIYLIEDEILVQKAAHGPKNPIEFDILNPITIPVGKGIVGTVAKMKQAIIIGDTSKDERYILDDDFRLSELAVPVMLDNEVIGVIDSEHPEKGFFTELHLSVLTTIASLMAIKISQAKAKYELEKANHNLEQLVEERTLKLEKALDKIKETNQNLQQFVYSISHDLRQPLRMISSYVQLLKRRFSSVLGDSGKEYVQFAYDGATQAQRLVLDLLEYSRVGVNSEDFQILDLNKIVELVLITAKIEIEKIQPVIVVEPLPKIRGVKMLMIQLFQNLVQNALKFRGSEQLRIKISVREELSQYVFVVQDNGIGIPTKGLNSIFEPFLKSNTKENQEGTGLGLAICKKIMERHHGEIWVNSEEGKGAAFYFSIPKY